MSRSSLRSQDVVGVVVLADQKGQGKKLAGCVRDSLRGTDVRAVKVDDVFAGGVVPSSSSYSAPSVLTWGRTPPPVPFESEDSQWQALLSDSRFKSRVASLGLSHLAIVSVSEYVGPPTTTSEFVKGGDVIGLDIVSRRTLQAEASIVVVDLRSQRLTARVKASGSGSSEHGVGMAYFLIPIPHWRNVSAFDPACKSLGIGVAASMVHMTDNPDEVGGCAFLGDVKDDDWGDMVKKVMKLRGNTVLLPADIVLAYTKKFPRKVDAGVYSCEAERGKTK